MLQVQPPPPHLQKMNNLQNMVKRVTLSKKKFTTIKKNPLSPLLSSLKNKTLRGSREKREGQLSIWAGPIAMGNPGQMPEYSRSPTAA